MEENQLINKLYYETFMREGEKRHPVQVLGELSAEEQINGMEDLSCIRFAQGEAYYHCKDYEAAIFKWENVRNELEPWARKNMGDAYLELGLYDGAEDIYKSISTDSASLQAECALQLYSLYLHTGDKGNADRTIKSAVQLDPDYPNVTDIARAFFENENDWDSAVELAANEIVRTESTEWMDMLKWYVDQGYTDHIQPGYFVPVLFSVYQADIARFEEMTAALWARYQRGEHFQVWLKEINEFLISADMQGQRSWRLLAPLYQESFMEFLGGEYLASDLADTMPDYLAAWLKVSGSSSALFAASAALAWNEAFPSQLREETVQAAEEKTSSPAPQYDPIGSSLEIYKSVREWTASREIEPNIKYDWLIGLRTDFSARTALVAGPAGADSRMVINGLLGQSAVQPENGWPALYRAEEAAAVKAVGPEEIRELISGEELAEAELGSIMLDFALPSRLLKENRLALMSAPIFDRPAGLDEEALDALHAADAFICVLDSQGFTNSCLNQLLDIQERMPGYAIDFVLHEPDGQPEEASVEDITAAIHSYFPGSDIFIYSRSASSEEQSRALSEFIASGAETIPLEKNRARAILHYIRSTISCLLKQRSEVETEWAESIRWSQEMESKLNGSIHQLNDMESEKISVLKSGYETIKKDIRTDIERKIPSLMKGAADIVKEDSDFSRIHLELNDEMNRRVRDYLEQSVLPVYEASLQRWILLARDHFKQSRDYLDEMGESLNALFGDRRMELVCDFQILDDWQRDADRMTSSLEIDKQNILLKRTPAQVLMKGMGKLIGVLPNNHLLYDKYKSFIENEDYSEAASAFADQFLRQFELFEKAIERDVKMFFKQPIRALRQELDETKHRIAEGELRFEEFQANPELFRDPLKLFKVRIRQLEIMLN